MWPVEMGDCRLLNIIELWQIWVGSKRQSITEQMEEFGEHEHEGRTSGRGEAQLYRNVLNHLSLIHCCCLVTKPCPTLCNPMKYSPSLSPRDGSNSCPLIQRGHPTISFSVTLFSSCPQSFPASGSFPVSRLFTSSGQSFGPSVSASASALLMNIHD